MQRMDNELLVDSNFSSASLFSMDNVACDAEPLEFVLNLPHSASGSETKKTESPEPEGNINTAMDLYAPDQSSVSSSNSRVSTSSTLGPTNLSSSSEPKDTSDSDRVGQFKVKLGNNYMTLLNEHDQQDAMSVTSDSSFGEIIGSFGRVYSPKNSPSTPNHRPPAPPTRHSRTSSPYFPNSSITFPASGSAKAVSTKKWAMFGDDKENQEQSNTEKPKLTPVRAPPAIPDRKSVSKRHAATPTPPSCSPTPAPDLLSMGMDDLEVHLSDISVPLPTPTKPAIPPRKNLFSNSSADSGIDQTNLFSLSGANCHLNDTRLSSSSVSPVDFLCETHQKSIAGPPIPPRKIEKVFSHADLDQTSESPVLAAGTESDSSSNTSMLQTRPNDFLKCDEPFSLDVLSTGPSWVNFDESPLSSSKPSLEKSAVLSGLVESQSRNKPSIAIDCNGDVQSSDHNFLEDEDASTHWKEPSSSPDVRSSKKKGGMGYLCLENDDCDNTSSSENIGSKAFLETPLICLPDNDLSPEKPQSQWSTFQNEEDEEENNLETENVSCTNSSFGINSSSGLADSINDVDLEDDFGLGVNRLSTDLKGFNRADKGSQNNLVDFSDDRASAAASIGSQENNESDDAETIFDLTAQGDSLKRRRPKASEKDEEDCDSVGVSDKAPADDEIKYHVGLAGIDNEAILEEENNLYVSVAQDAQLATVCHSSGSSRAATPADSSDTQHKSSFSTNPFWSTSTTSSENTILHSTALDSPFDKVIFNAPNVTQVEVTSSKHSTPVHAAVLNSPSSSSLIRLPPPPSRSSSRSKRSGTAKNKVCQPVTTAAKKLDWDSASDASVKSLPSSRTGTPSAGSVKNESALVSSASTVTNADRIFDPSSGGDEASSNPFASTVAQGEDFFQWTEPIENSIEISMLPEVSDEKLVENIANDKVENLGHKLQDITLILEEVQISDTTQSNTNTNAQVPAIPSPVMDRVSADELCSEKPEVNMVLPATLEDPLTELEKATSVESPNGIQESKRPVLPEVEIVEAKTAWDVLMRFPREKRAMSNRKWVPIHIKLNCNQIDEPQVQLFYTARVKEPFDSLRLASHQMQVSKSKLQARYSDEGQVLGKLHAVKLMVVNYKEKQIFSPRRSLSRNAMGFKHACRGKQSIKLGFLVHHDMLSFCKAARDAAFEVHKRRPKSKENEEHVTSVKYHSRDELLIDVCDELQALVTESAVLEACKLRVHLNVTSFLSGDPMAKITLNDRKHEGREVVRREDIMPTSMGSWIDIFDPELHECCTYDSYGKKNDEHAGACTFYPPDACKFELMRFTASYVERELPVIVKASCSVKGARIELRCVVRMSSKHSANKDPLTQIPCEDVMIRFPVPDEWSGFFRVDGRFRNHSVRAKRAAKQRRRPSSEAGVTMESSVGMAKYERAYRSIVWRMPRLPEKNAVQNTPRVFSCRAELPSDQDLRHLRTRMEDSPGDGYKGGLDSQYKWCEAEFTMPGSTASNTCIRSVSLPNTNRAEKFVCYQSHYLYKVAMNLSSEPVGMDGEEDVGTTLCSVQ